MTRPAAALVVAAVLALLAALYAGAAALDERTDRQRPMYDDVLAVAQQEWEHARLTGAPLAFSLREGGTQVLGGTQVRLSPGTTSIDVLVDGAGYCVSASNVHGDATGPLCFDGEDRPASVQDSRLG